MQVVPVLGYKRSEKVTRRESKTSPGRLRDLVAKQELKVGNRMLWNGLEAWAIAKSV
jgi:hypothetical protein